MNIIEKYEYEIAEFLIVLIGSFLFTAVYFSIIWTIILLFKLLKKIINGTKKAIKKIIAGW